MKKSKFDKYRYNPLIHNELHPVKKDIFDRTPIQLIARYLQD